MGVISVKFKKKKMKSREQSQKLLEDLARVLRALADFRNTQAS